MPTQRAPYGVRGIHTRRVPTYGILGTNTRRSALFRGSTPVSAGHPSESIAVKYYIKMYVKFRYNII